MVSGFIPLTVRTCRDVFRDVGVHHRPPEVLPHKFDCLPLSEVSCHVAVVFGFEDGGNHKLGNVEASLVVEYVVGFHRPMCGWFNIIGAVWVSAEGTQTQLILLVLPSTIMDLLKKVVSALDSVNRIDLILVGEGYDVILA